jgi:hypothetical protein
VLQRTPERVDLAQVTAHHRTSSPASLASLASLAVTVATATVICPVVVAVAAAPAWAERIPPGPAPSASGALAPAGTVQSLALTGPARLMSPSTVTASAVVDVPGRTRATITVTVAGRSCASSAVAPTGRTRLSVGCALTPTAAEIPALPGTVVVSLDRVEAGRALHTRVTAKRSVTLDDGPDRPYAEAKARWTALAVALRAEAGGISESFFGSADLAGMVWREAQTSGWSSPATQGLITNLLAGRKATGGYGLDAAWDAYGDGTTNPAGTTYTVTTAGHVGWVLLEAYKNRALPAGGLESAVDAVLAMPRLSGGTCIAYSNSPNDSAKPCVYNVTHGAAAFLVQVRGLSDHRAGEIDALVQTLRSRLTDGYDPATGYWVYKAGDTKGQEISHQVYTADSVEVVDPAFGAIARMMVLPWWRHPGGAAPPRVSLASAMMSIARDCRYARSPAVLVAGERGLGSGAPSFKVLGMSAVADEIQQKCFSA